MTSRIQIASVIGGLLMVAMLPGTAQAQDVDSRWGAWLGCWELVTQPERLDPREAALDSEAIAGVARDARICVEPDGGGVTMRTLVEGAPVLEQTMVADGSSRPIERDGCRGTERVWWSSNGLRLFSEAQLTCAGSSRTVSGMALIGADGRWVDVQSVQVGAGDTVRVRHFEPDIARSAVPSVSGANLTIEEVVEASEAVSPSTLEAAILESRSRFPLSGQVLVDLAETGVPGSVTDLMVAVTFPDQFQVQRTRPDDRVARLDPYPYVAGWAWGSYWDRYLYSSYYDSAYYYSPFGYGYLGSYPTVIVTGSGGGGGGGSVLDPGSGGATGPGRVINGQGYTRVQSLTGAESAARRGGGGGSVSPQGFTSGGSASSGASSGSSSSGGSSSGGGGTSSGGSSGGGGRTAVPR